MKHIILKGRRWQLGSMELARHGGLPQQGNLWGARNEQSGVGDPCWPLLMGTRTPSPSNPPLPSHSSREHSSSHCRRALNTFGDQRFHAISQKTVRTKPKPTKTKSSKDKVGCQKALLEKSPVLSQMTCLGIQQHSPKEALPPLGLFTHGNERGNFFHVRWMEQMKHTEF